MASRYKYFLSLSKRFLKDYTCCKLYDIKMSMFKVRYNLVSRNKNIIYITQQKIYLFDNILHELEIFSP